MGFTELERDEAQLIISTTHLVTKASEKLRHIRVNRIGISQTDLAELSGVSRSTISKMESKNITHVISLSNFIRICSALQVKPSDILEQ